MSILKSAEVHGLWGDRQISVKFDSKVNFLIGANGSGKTTFLNLIASALNSDFEGLARNQFGEIRCLLQSSKSDGPTEIRVHRAGEDEETRLSFVYTIQTGDKDPRRFELVNPSPRYLLPPSIRRKSNTATFISDSDMSPLNELVKVKWITVHRAPTKIRGEERAVSDSSVDRRLTVLSNQLVRYFSELAAQREQETTRFLRQMLSAIVYDASEFDPFNSTKDVDLKAVQVSIESLIERFLNPSAARKVKEKLDAHFQLAVRATGESTFELDELVALAAVLPMKRIVEEWEHTQVKQEIIARPRTEFIEILNSMYHGKELSLNQKNELEVSMPRGKNLPLSELSSGEKQLLILFAEGLLQEKGEFIYIADEPELSLHVTWQEQLTRNLLKINPYAQIIFATHSPDIVSEFGDRTIDMETLIS